MARRVGPGPVFIYESLIFARRRQVYAGRVLFVLAMLAGLWISWWNNVDTPGPGQPLGSRPGTLQALARAGASFFFALAGIQLSMVLLVAPAATAGALCQDRARGILAQMATTDLSDSEIVLGKLFSRLAPILALLACALPVVSLAALLGGIDGAALVGLFAVSAAVAVLGCALALSISVEVVKTDEVVMAVLAFTTCWLLSLPLWGGMARVYGLPPPPEWFYATNPFVLVYAPYTWPGHFGLLEVAIFVAAALAISAGLLAMTIARLRRFVLPAEVGRRKRKLRFPALGAAVAPRGDGGDPAMAGAAAGAVARRQPRALARVAPVAAVADGADSLGALLARRGPRDGDRHPRRVRLRDRHHHRRLHDPHRRWSCNRCSA